MPLSDYRDGIIMWFFCGSWKELTLNDKLISGMLAPPQTISTTLVKKI